MQQPNVIHNTFVIERRYPVPPQRVFAAFSDREKRRRWFAGDDPGVERFDLDFRVGGRESMCRRMGSDTPFPGVPLASEVYFLDIVPGQRVVTGSYMTLGDKRISAALLTIELLPVEGGTDLICTHQGAFFEGSDGPERREAGYRTLFDRLGAELER